MGPIGMQEMIVIFLIILLLFGAKKIPELARNLGRSAQAMVRAQMSWERTAELVERSYGEALSLLDPTGSIRGAPR